MASAHHVESSDAARQSLAAWLTGHPEERAEFLSGLSPEEALALKHDWRFWARSSQLPPTGDGWDVWAIVAGRGFGKTRPAAEYLVSEAEKHPGWRICVIGQNPKEYRGVMVEGESGLVACSPPWFPADYQPSKSRVVWPNGSMAELFSAETPDALRGPQFHLAWPDEFAKYRQPQAVWDMLMLSLRLGAHPKCILTTTPLPIPVLRRILADARTVVTGGSTFENAANLAPTFLQQIRRQYEGTRLGRQELFAEILEDTPGALWTLDRLERNRVTAEQVPELTRIVIAVDPSGTADPETGAEAGIVAAGLGVDGHGYVLHDWSGHYTPGQWGALACRQFVGLRADRIIGERNYGGQMVAHTIKMAAKDLGVTVAYKDVNASRGKQLRAEPVAALDEQGRVHLVGVWPDLEDQLVTWVPGMKSPDRLDACLVGSTLVTTRRGQVPIADVTTADDVWTRAGYQRVLWAGRTHTAAPTVTVTFSDGRTLRGTADHPAWTEQRGFIPLDTLVCGDRMITCSQSRKLWCLKGFVTLASQAARISQRPAGVGSMTSIGRSGGRYMARFRRGITSIIATAIPTTTIRRTWNFSHRKSTAPVTLRNFVINAVNGLPRFALSPWPGIALQPAGPGIVNTGNSHGWGDAQERSRAHIAGDPPRNFTRHARESTIALAVAAAPWQTRNVDTSSGFRAPSAAPSSGRTSTSIGPRRAPVFVVRSYVSAAAPVYNLTVANQPEFFANGVLVHNCVWAMTELMVKQPGEFRVLNLGDGEPQTEDEQRAADAARIAAAAQVIDEALLHEGIYWPHSGRM